jgi:hypothetical protein
MVSHRRLQQYALVISIVSVVYNGIEGGLSIGFGAESNSRSLIFFGIQSAVEVASACVVVWRFRNVAKPGEERNAILDGNNLRWVCPNANVTHFKVHAPDLSVYLLCLSASFS